MDILKLVDLQRKLDNKIYLKFNLDENATFVKRKLALIVELGELANEVRCFKFWSVKKRSEESVILEEFVDCLHFCLSLGITMQIDFSSLQCESSKTTNLTTSFLNLNTLVTSLELNSISEYETLYCELFNLANNLGFSTDSVLEAYLEKNKQNHNRQDNNY